jgi:hypothetical protein
MTTENFEPQTETEKDPWDFGGDECQWCGCQTREDEICECWMNQE